MNCIVAELPWLLKVAVSVCLTATWMVLTAWIADKENFDG